MRGTPAALAGALGLLLAPACAGPIVATDGGFAHRRNGFAIAAPPAPEWRRVELAGADLAFRDASGAALALSSRCGRPVASSEAMAQQLRIGLRGLRRLDAGPVLVDGRDAWRQRFEAGAGAEPARVTTVTLVAGRCSFDWMLVARGSSPAEEAALDVWCASFRLDPARFPAAAP